MSIARSSIIVTILTIIGLVLNFLSNMVIAMMFGARTDMDVFLAATTVPDLITSILSSALNFTFIPVFAEYRANEPAEGWKVVSSFINLSLIFTVLMCVMGMSMAEPLTRILVPGFTQDKVTAAANLFRWLLPLIVFTIVNSLMASVYYSDHRFIAPTLNKVISPIITMIYVFLFHRTLSTKSLILAMVTAAFMQTVILAVGFFKKRDYHYSFSFDHKHPGVIKIFKLMTPLVLGMIVYRAVPVFDRYFLSGLPVGSISHIGYAMKLITALSTVIVSGISVAIFPTMARYQAEGKMRELKNLMSKGLRMLFFISLPTAIFLGVFGKSVVKLVYERGAFTAIDTLAVYYCFSAYVIALPATVVGTVLGQGFYVLKDTMTIALIGVGEMVLYIFLCYTLLPRLGYLAIPTAFAVQLNLGAMTNGLVLRYKFGNKGGTKILLSMAKDMTSALVPLSVIFVFFGFAFWGSVTSIVFVVICFIVYLLLSRFVFITDESVSICNKIMNMIKRVRVAQ
jgi:putative peptidoglycan lipid II flippase